MWVNFTNVQISESIDFYWYFPNGTEHFQSTGGSLPTGYAWDTGDGYMPLGGTAAASVTGVWHVTTYVGGAEILDQPFYVGSYSSPLTISFSTLAPELNSTTNYPINSTIYYTTNSSQVNSYVLFANVGSGTYNATFDFISPSGTSYANASSGSFSGPSSSIYVYAYLDVYGYPAANSPGTWEVLVYVNNNFTSPALVQLFVVSS